MSYALFILTLTAIFTGLMAVTLTVMALGVYVMLKIIGTD